MDDTSLRLERHQPAKNMQRFYALQVTPNLFGEWCLLKVWGRIGRRGQLRTEYFRTQQEAEVALRELEKKKRKHGYREKQQRPPICEMRNAIYCGDFPETMNFLPH